MLIRDFSIGVMLGNLCAICAICTIWLRWTKSLDTASFYKVVLASACGVAVFGSWAAWMLGSASIPSWPSNVFSLGFVSYGTFLVIDFVYAALLACSIFPFTRAASRERDENELASDTEALRDWIRRINRFEWKMTGILIVGIVFLEYVLPWILGKS